MAEGTETGWVRLIPGYSPAAVSWWFIRVFPDGFAYARGGRVRSAREARKQIRLHWDASLRERKIFQNRPTHALGDEGQLVPLNLPKSPSLHLRELPTGRSAR